MINLPLGGERFPAAVHKGISLNRQGTLDGSGMTLGSRAVDGSASTSGGASGGRLRIQQFGRVGDKPGRLSPAGNFQDALFVRLHDVLVADPDNRIIFHLGSPKLPEPPHGILQVVTDRSAKKITKGELGPVVI